MNQNSNSNVHYKPRAYTNLIGSMEKFWPLPMLRKNTLQTLTKLMDKTNLRWCLLHGQKKKGFTHTFSKVGGIGKMNLVRGLLPSSANFPKGDIK
jgi:hypothetical protein